MEKRTRQNIYLALAGVIFLLAGLRDLFFPGVLTLNSGLPSKADVVISMALGLFFVGLAAFRSLS
jgi:hypothetical protein